MPVASRRSQCQSPVASRQGQSQSPIASRQSKLQVAGRHLPTQRVGPRPRSSPPGSILQPAGPAAPLSQGHNTIAGLRRHNAHLSPKSKAKARSHYVANATTRATPQQRACLCTRTSSVHKHAKAAKGPRSPPVQHKSAYASGNSRGNPHAPSSAKARPATKEVPCKHTLSQVSKSPSTTHGPFHPAEGRATSCDRPSAAK